MNKEQIINKAYENYEKITNNFQLENPIDDFIIKTLGGEMIKIETEDGDDYRILTQEEFIDKCKTDPEFSETWGLKIEERELSLEERHQLALPIWKEKYGPLADMMVLTNVDNTPYKIPRKIITITYNTETIENYEH